MSEPVTQRTATKDSGRKPSVSQGKRPVAAPKAKRGRSSVDHSGESNLSMYFRDMSGLTVLGPEQEVQIAQRIEGITIELWEKLLGYPPLLDGIIRVTREHVELPARRFRSLRQAASERRKHNSAANREKYQHAVSLRAKELAEVDFDDLALKDILGELGRARRGLEPRLLRKTRIKRNSGVFQDYLLGVQEGEQRLEGAKHDFVEANLRLVVSIARRFNNGRMPLSDLIQEGNIGLMKAVERFDYRRGFRFSTYASWWIRHAISRALADKGRAVRLPVHMIDTYQKLSRSTRELQAELGRKPSPEEVSEKSGVPLPKIMRMNSYLLERAVSLDRPVNDSDGRRFIDFLVDESSSVNTADTLIQRAERDEALRVMDELTPIECDILKRRFGLEGCEESTLKEIGEIYSLSRERIRQLQEQALTKVRRALKRKDLM